MSFQLLLNKKVKFNYYIIFYLFGKTNNFFSLLSQICYLVFKFWNKYAEGEI